MWIQVGLGQPETEEHRGGWHWAEGLAPVHCKDWLSDPLQPDLPPLFLQ